MKKIPTLFLRDPATRLVRDQVTPGCEWVQAGEGYPYMKWDGTACLVSEGCLYKRFDAKGGKTPPPGFQPAQEPDLVTGHWPGWVPVSPTDPADRWHREAFEGRDYPDATYELIGPKVQGNSHRLDTHFLVDHRLWEEHDVPTDFEGLRAWLATCEGEGVVWHHLDGRMAKIKRRDFGLPWPAPELPWPTPGSAE